MDPNERTIYDQARGRRRVHTRWYPYQAFDVNDSVCGIEPILSNAGVVPLLANL